MNNEGRYVTTLLADPEAIHLEKIIKHHSSLTLVVRATRTEAECPRCHCPSTHVHSYYVRALGAMMISIFDGFRLEARPQHLALAL